MKKFLFATAALALVATTANAQNLVVNGSFNDPGFEQAVPESYTWSPVDEWNDLSVLPGWTLTTGGIWNGVIQVITEEPGDDDPRPEEDEEYLNLQGYNDNGWTKIAISQVVKGLEVGKEYVFKYQYDYNFPDGAQSSGGWAPDPDYGAVISEVDVDNSGAYIAGRELLNYANPNGSERSSGAWLQFETKFTATVSEIYLEIYLGNYYYEGNKKDGLYLDLDNVEIYDLEKNAVEVIFDNNAPVEYYNLQGVRVNANDAAKGIFIKKQGNKVAKVAL